MRNMADILDFAEMFLSTKQKRHLIGGTLISISLLFGGLAVTIISLKGD